MIQFTNKLLNISLSILLLATLGVTALAQGPEHSVKQGQPQGGAKPDHQMDHSADRGQDMQTIHVLFDQHKSITRTVKNIENGVETITESNDPKVQALIKEHTWAMKARLKNHRPIRQWDPLFAALFEHADKIKLEVTNTAKGVKVTETSADAYVVKLIQSHAASISEHVKEGPPSMPKRHELPDAAPKAEQKFLGKGDGVTTCPVTGEAVDKNISAEINGRTVDRGPAPGALPTADAGDHG
jgi:hypothetical protein